jgi:two-component system, OmpR family, response regulator
MKLLLIEDDKQTASFVVRGLEQVGHTVDLADTGTLGHELALRNPYDILIIDRMLPQLSGLDIIGSLRKQNIMTPVLMLTALSSVEDRVEGLEAGADDYLGKPFAFTELLARVRALHRRAGVSGAVSDEVLRVADMELDLKKRRVMRGGRRLDLTPQEFKLLEFMVSRAGETVTRTMLLENLWGYDFDPRTNIVDAHMSRLRAKIDKGFDTSLLRTLRGIGYVIDEPV